ncbi:F-box domain, Leucine-rich repeat domain, L domain-like protein [Artemisia annua]|uniref:F-box domain, Leucine-rich repeat domain, L domain-like protein n=1 Tax=Artemisia annua TaxID=35608 RepID=A0A2U1KST1_ARTAN|nr:F-box domain, Leucine-rich repeat domain, L domain-like protein [Artemisia annua]
MVFSEQSLYLEFATGDMENLKVIKTDTKDRISQLPESILHHILAFLDSPKQLVRMSVLSKNWFAIMASFPILDFDIGNFNRAIHGCWSPISDSIYVIHKFFNYVDSTTSRFCNQNITSAQTFTLSTMIEKPMQIDIVDRCLELILMKGVKVLKVDFSNWAGVISDKPLYRLPKILLSASSLTSLKICRCKLPLSLIVDVVKFKSLKMLKLEHVPLSEKMIKHLMTGCPLLEKLTIKHCYGFKRFCVYGLQSLQQVRICFVSEVERVDIEALNLYYLVLNDWDGRVAPSMNLASCKKLTKLSYSGCLSSTLEGLVDLSFNFPFLETLILNLPDKCSSLKLSSHSLKTLMLYSECDLENIDINTPNLLLFGYNGYSQLFSPTKSISDRSKARMEFVPNIYVDTLWFRCLRQFLDKKIGFKELKLNIMVGTIDIDELKVSMLAPYELEHVELDPDDIDTLSEYVDVVDALLWCCRPWSLTLGSHPFLNLEKERQIIESSLKKQDNQTGIKFADMEGYIVFGGTNCRNLRKLQ